MSHVFDREKARVLTKADLSRKGSIDAPIRPLVEYINALDDFYTTSSCSGRAVVFCEEQGHRKKGCHWLLVSHDPIDSDSLLDACVRSSSLVRDSEAKPNEDLGYTFFKFEPFVLHAMCRTMDCAQTLVAVGAGFRNSGITFGKKGKTMLAIRSTHSLEVPACHNGELLVSKEYLRHLVVLCSAKFSENTQRIERFFQELKSLMELKKEELKVASTSKQSRLLQSKRQGDGPEETNTVRPMKEEDEDKSYTEELCFDSLFEPGS